MIHFITKSKVFYIFRKVFCVFHLSSCALLTEEKKLPNDSIKTPLFQISQLESHKYFFSFEVHTITAEKLDCLESKSGWEIINTGSFSMSENIKDVKENMITQRSTKTGDSTFYLNWRDGPTKSIAENGVLDLNRAKFSQPFMVTRGDYSLHAKEGDYAVGKDKGVFKTNSGCEISGGNHSHLSNNGLCEFYESDLSIKMFDGVSGRIDPEEK